MMPICNKGKYLEKFLDFKKYGFLNLKDKKVKFTLVSSQTENFKKDQIYSNWTCQPEEIIYLKSPFEDAPSKIHWYYLNYLKKDRELARWWIKIDDDTANNVSEIINELDKEYDWKDDYYIGTYIHCCTSHFEHNVIKSTKIKNVPYAHEWEMCVVSHSALQKITDSCYFNNVLIERLKDKGGWGDRILAVISILEKIHPIDNYFLSYDCPLNNFSILTGKHIHHIHFQNTPENKGKFEFYKSILNLNQKEKIMKWKYFNDQKEKEIKMNNDGIILFNDSHWGLWTEYNGNIFLNRKDVPDKIFQFPSEGGQDQTKKAFLTYE